MGKSENPPRYVDACEVTVRVPTCDWPGRDPEALLGLAVSRMREALPPRARVRASKLRRIDVWKRAGVSKQQLACLRQVEATSALDGVNRKTVASVERRGWVVVSGESAELTDAGRGICYTATLWGIDCEPSEAPEAQTRPVYTGVPGHARIVADTTSMPREEWLAWRKYEPGGERGGVGGSDAAYIVYPDDTPKWSSPFQVWTAILDGHDVPHEDDDGDGTLDAASIGQALEGTVASMVGAQLGWAVEELHAILAHPDYPRVRANIDRILVRGTTRVGLEVKAVGGFHDDALRALASDPGDPWRGEVLGTSVFVWWVQCQAYMAVTGTREWVLGVLSGGQYGMRLHVLPIPRCDATCATLVETMDAFWRAHVETGVAPPVDWRDVKLVSSAYEMPGSATNVDASEEDAELVGEWLAAKANAEASERQRRDLEAAIKQRLAEVGGTRLICADGKVTWKGVVSGGMDRGLGWFPKKKKEG